MNICKSKTIIITEKEVEQLICAGLRHRFEDDEGYYTELFIEKDKNGFKVVMKQQDEDEEI